MNPSQVDRDLYCLASAGFIVMKDFLSNASIEALCAEVLDFEAEVREYARACDVDFRHGWPLITTRCVYCVSQAVQDVAMSDRIQNIAQKYLGGALIRDCLLQTNMPDPRNKTRGVGAKLSYHRDTLWTGDAINPAYLHAFVLLTDFTSENGATYVVPGSHRFREPGYYFKHSEKGSLAKGVDYLVYDQAYFPSVVQLLAPRGSLIFLDPMTIHSQGVNVTDQSRSLLNITFRKEGIVANPPLLNARRIASRSSRVPVRQDFLDLLEADPDLPSHFGPLGTDRDVRRASTHLPWEKVMRKDSRASDAIRRVE
jgi:hypothetical protein